MGMTKSEEAKRLELQSIFENLLGSKNVYFQPPDNLKMKYPCILYFKSQVRMMKADDGNYLMRQGYTVTVVDKDPDSQIPYDILNALKFSRIDSFYRASNLNHTKLTIFY